MPNTFGNQSDLMKILHFSDVHMTTEGADTQFDRDAKIRAAIMDDLGKEGRDKFDAILITGDIAYHGQTDEFARAKKWLDEVQAKTNSAIDSIYVIPGNHDVNRSTLSKSSSLWDLHQSLRNEMPDEERYASLDKKLQDPFDFLTGLVEYRSFASEFGCPTDPGKLAWVHVLDQTLEDGSLVRLHGLNSVLISDGEDKKANLLLGPVQFHHFSPDPAYVNVALCHHPSTWLIDGNNAEDFFRNQSHVVLCGHEHDSRAYKVGSSLRIFAGAVHPNPRESHWEPCYHVLHLSIDTTGKRTLVAQVETRIWLDHDKCFGPRPVKGGTPFQIETMELPDWKPSRPVQATVLDSKPAAPAVSSPKAMIADLPMTSDAIASARRRLYMHFHRLGVISRLEAAMESGVWEDGDDALTGPTRWSRIFERAEKKDKLAALWNSVAAKDPVLSTQKNPFDIKK